MSAFEELLRTMAVTFGPILLALVIAGVWWAVRRGGRG